MARNPEADPSMSAREPRQYSEPINESLTVLLKAESGTANMFDVRLEWIPSKDRIAQND